MSGTQKILSWGVFIFILVICFTMLYPMFKQSVTIVSETELVPVGKNAEGQDTFLLWTKGMNGGAGNKEIIVTAIAGVLAFLNVAWRKK